MDAKKSLLQKGLGLIPWAIEIAGGISLTVGGMDGGSTFTWPPLLAGSHPKSFGCQKGNGSGIDSHSSIACPWYVSMLLKTNHGYLLLSETPGNMLFYEIFVSNNFQQLFGIFFLLSSLSCTSSPPFQRDCVICRNVELKGPEFLQQEFVLEASELEGEETGSPPRASAGLSHPFSKLQPGQLMSWGWACF